MPDFTLKKYLEFCSVLQSCEYRILTISKYLDLQGQDALPQKFVIIRHDVDRWIAHAVAMAEAEQNRGIACTYYFRYPATFSIDTIQHISRLQHEIGYHYEVLSKNNGDVSEAINQFERELSHFRQYVQVDTICMHGNPFSPYDNRPIWNYYNFRDYGLKGEAYLSLSGLLYLTDTGRTWSGTRAKYDYLSGNSNPGLNNTDDLIRWIIQTSPEQLYLTIHPERWATGIGSLVVRWITDYVLFVGKKVLLMRK